MSELYSALHLDMTVFQSSADKSEGGVKGGTQKLVDKSDAEGVSPRQLQLRQLEGKERLETQEWIVKLDEELDEKAGGKGKANKTGR